MGLQTTMQFVKQVLDNLPMPGDLGNLIAYLDPPDPDDDPPPKAYVWDAKGKRHRDSGPRNFGAAGGGIRGYSPALPAGWKLMDHSIDVYVTWFSDSDNSPNADSEFPAAMDAVMNALETCSMPEPIIDPLTGQGTRLITLGEDMSWTMWPMRSISDQRYHRWDGLITASALEVYNA